MNSRWLNNCLKDHDYQPLPVYHKVKVTKNNTDGRISIVFICLSMLSFVAFLFFTFRPQTTAVAVPEYPLKGFMPLETLLEIIEDWNNIILPNKTICGSVDENNETSVEFLLLVHSALDHYDYRNVIRQAVPNNFVTVFVLGRDINGSVTQEALQEQKEYGDLLIGHFMDSYRNMTIKHLLAWNYALKYCYAVDFVAKMDDDVFVDFVGVTAMASLRYPKRETSLYTRLGSKLFSCFSQVDMKVIRDPKNKWFVNQDDLLIKVYPEFCSGWFYFTSIESIEAVLLSLNHVYAQNPFWIDDVWLTGYLRTWSEDVFIDPINNKFNVNPEELDYFTSQEDLPCLPQFLVSDANSDVNALQAAYHKLNETRSVCGTKCLSCHSSRQHAFMSIHGNPVSLGVGRITNLRICG